MAKYLIFFSILILSTFSFLEAQYNGFSVDLIHRDSPRSPVYNPSLTYAQRLTNALHRSFHRAHHFSNHSQRLPRADIVSDNGEYLMRVSIGTPPVSTLVIADTGSDLIWTQCQPCMPCFDQDSSLFSPKKSSSYKRVACHDPKCLALESSNTCHVKMGKSCSYTMKYGDTSVSKGDLATDTIKLGKVSFPNIILGCGHENSGSYSSGSSGIMGLGGGELSLISQLRSSINGKFSYCLVPLKANKTTSKINFGRNGLVLSSGEGSVLVTPIVPKYPDTYYYLTLEGISVKTEKLEFFNLGLSGEPEGVDEGNIIIDSGTTLTFLPIDFYTKLESGVKSQINKKTVDDPAKILTLCYDSLSDEEIPEITLHFKNADLKLKPYNIFVKTTDSIKCLAFSATEGLPIYGNIAQSNFLIGYDLEKKTVSFKPTDCTKLK